MKPSPLKNIVPEPLKNKLKRLNKGKQVNTNNYWYIFSRSSVASAVAWLKEQWEKVEGEILANKDEGYYGDDVFHKFTFPFRKVIDQAFADCVEEK